MNIEGVKRIRTEPEQTSDGELVCQELDKLEEYMPSLNVKSEAGSIDLFDCIEKRD